ncbi:MAG: hypothetical protein HC809_03400 [Gammaproteobacteria bacterium]|nr:hypothetical protein [Gammaproteobacteria bacterium]
MADTAEGCATAALQESHVTLERQFAAPCQRSHGGTIVIAVAAESGHVAGGAPVSDARITRHQPHFIVSGRRITGVVDVRGVHHLPHAHHASTDFLEERPDAITAHGDELIECALPDAEVTQGDDGIAG